MVGHDLADLDPIAEYYGNRAAAHVMQKNFRGALDDSLTAIRIDATFIKAYLRAAKCHVHLGDFAPALQLLAVPAIKTDADVRVEVCASSRCSCWAASF